MAEIKIQPRKPSKWPWILAALALAAVIFLIVRNTSQHDPVQPVEATVDTSSAKANSGVPPTVNSFVEFVQVTGNVKDPDMPQAYAADGIRYLSGALGGVISQANIQNRDIAQKSTELTKMADRIKQDSAAVNQSGKIKEVFLSASDLMGLIQKEKYPNLSSEIQKVKQSANAIDSKKKTTEQGNQIKTFFVDASNAIKAMTGMPADSVNTGRTRQ